MAVAVSGVAEIYSAKRSSALSRQIVGFRVCDLLLAGLVELVLPGLARH
jgi:hypothetical protein